MLSLSSIDPIYRVTSQPLEFLPSSTVSVFISQCSPMVFSYSSVPCSPLEHLHTRSSPQLLGPPPRLAVLPLHSRPGTVGASLHAADSPSATSRTKRTCFPSLLQDTSSSALFSWCSLLRGFLLIPCVFFLCVCGVREGIFGFSLQVCSQHFFFPGLPVHTSPLGGVVLAATTTVLFKAYESKQ